MAAGDRIWVAGECPLRHLPRRRAGAGGPPREDTRASGAAPPRSPCRPRASRALPWVPDFLLPGKMPPRSLMCSCSCFSSTKERRLVDRGGCPSCLRPRVPVATRQALPRQLQALCAQGHRAQPVLCELCRHQVWLLRPVSQGAPTLCRDKLRWAPAPGWEELCPLSLQVGHDPGTRW